MRKHILQETEQELIRCSEEMFRAGKRFLDDPSVSQNIKTMVNTEMIAHRILMESVGLSGVAGYTFLKGE